MMSAQNLLIELFVEELPPKALRELGASFARILAEQLLASGLTQAKLIHNGLASHPPTVPGESLVTAYASPRRLGVHITQVLPRAADRAVQQKLMPVSVGLDAQGGPTPALLKKLQGLGVEDPAAAVAALKRQSDGKAQALFYDSVLAGVSLAEGLQKALHQAIAQLPIPKVMSYQLESDCELPGWSSVHFVRPAHGLMALHGNAIVPVKALGLSASDRTQGHRFEALRSPVVVPHADQYAEVLARDGAVVARFEERRTEIERQLQAAAARLGGGCARSRMRICSMRSPPWSSGLM